MAILINKNTKIVIQGITGHEGSRAEVGSLDYGTPVLAGVTPGKGGQTTPAGTPVYDTVQQAIHSHPDSNVSFIAVPAPFVLDAALEAIYHRLPLINILTEHVPVHHVARIIQAARAANIRVVGPSSVGIISPGKAKIGSIGSSDIAHRVFSPGPIGVISKSGGMTAEISRILTDAGYGQSTAVGIGGDVLLGSDFLDLARLFEADRQTKAIVIFGEVGGVYEERLADAIATKEITKPIVALIAGDFGKRLKLPSGTVLGHAGAIVSGTSGSAASKKKVLQKAGAHIAPTPEDIPKLLKKVL